MAVYKVIQDIEAEDKLLGPLTLKGFIYAAIAALLGFINFRLLVASSIGPIRWPFILVLSLPMILFGVLAAPLGREQPTEVWLLSRIRFFLKNRTRIWDQSGMNHLVTITVPKKIERILTKNFSQTEVKSRLQALASTLDSRGWVIKDVSLNASDIPGYLQTEAGDSDRLVGASSLVGPGPISEIKPADDIMDAQNNSTAQHFSELMQTAEAKRKDDVASILSTARAEAITPSEGARQTASAADGSQTSSDGTSTDTYTNEEQAFLDKEHAEEQKLRSAHPIVGFTSQEDNKPVSAADKTRQNTVTATHRADNINLARSGNAFSVASLEKLANRPSSQEVVINLH
jgi:hypothetical protein